MLLPLLFQIFLSFYLSFILYLKEILTYMEHTVGVQGQGSVIKIPSN